MFTPFLLLLLSGSVILPGLRLWQRLDIELIQSRERLSLIKSYQLITKESPSSNPAFLNGLKRSNITDVFVSIQRLAGNSGVKIESMKPAVLENRVDILQDIVLVGIMDDKGRKAIVEDKKASKTYFLSVGDSFAGVQIVEIKDNEVIFNKEGNQCSLML
ncbi:MAG: hypothetical protein AUJ74_01780 [Candidatus Omnitrophica bacterium CG1_02_44_16]|nr:MAG: hypothetical protein AUJ74_01780 [Candidatus Omnitrophica bacterium CG1_02_44_16]PIY83537.1 MAG: hypothetical protein COY78_01715 [Candidatus Omnitrophica bacterium CG_4_10_14_0_8_um_filter_44_12]